MLTKQQKQWFKNRFQEVKAYLLQCIPKRDEKGNIISFTNLSLHLCIQQKNWKEFIKNYEDGRKKFDEGISRERYSPIVFPGDDPCKIMNYRCDYWKGTDKWQEGEGYNECPEFVINFCYVTPRDTKPIPLFWRATCARKCAERLAQKMVEQGENAPNAKDICRYCKSMCHRYNECMSKNKTLYEQFMFCQWVANQITEDTIKEIDKIIAMCS